MEVLHIDIDIDGFKIKLETAEPDAIKNYSAQILDLMREHVQSVSRGRLMAETMMLQQMQDPKPIEAISQQPRNK